MTRRACIILGKCIGSSAGGRSLLHLPVIYLHEPTAPPTT